MKIEYLVYLREITNCRSISAASKRLFIGQTTLSAIVKSMEEELGIQIYERTSSGVSLTPDGEYLQRFADRVVEQYNDMMDVFRSSSGMVHKVHFAADITACQYFSPFLSHMTGTTLKDASIVFNQYPRRKLLTALIDGRANIGAGFFDPNTEAPTLCAQAKKNGVQVRAIGRDQFYLCVRADNEKYAGKTLIDINTLRDEPYVAPTHYSTVPNGTTISDTLRKLHCVAVLPNPDLVLRTVAECNYITVLTGRCLMSSVLVQQGVLVAIPLTGFPIKNETSLYLLNNKRSAMNLDERAVYDALIEFADATEKKYNAQNTAEAAGPHDDVYPVIPPPPLVAPTKSAL